MDENLKAKYLNVLRKAYKDAFVVWTDAGKYAMIQMGPNT